MLFLWPELLFFPLSEFTSPYLPGSSSDVISFGLRAALVYTLLCLLIIQQYLLEHSWLCSAVPARQAGTGWAFACNLCPLSLNSTDKQRSEVTQKTYHSNPSTCLWIRKARLCSCNQSEVIQTTAHEYKQDFCELHGRTRPGWSSVKAQWVPIKATTLRGLLPDTS